MQKNIPQLRFPGFKGEWDLKKLVEVCQKIKDGTHFSPKSFDEGEFQYLTSKNVKNGYIDFKTIQYISKVEHEKIYKSCDVKFGDVLLTKDGTIGQSCVNNLNYEFSLLSSVAYLRLTKENSNYFLYQILISPTGQKEISRTIAGQALQRITLTKINDFSFFFPTLLEQTKIANFLTQVDEKLTQLKSKKAKLEQYKKGVMQKIFSRELRFKDENGNNFPEWEEKKLGEVSDFLDGKRKPIKEHDRAQIKGKYPYYGASGIIDYVNDYIFDDEIILLGEDGENIISRNLPLAFKVSGKCWINNHAHVIKPKVDINIDFLTYNLERISYVQYNTGTAQPKLNQEICRGIILPFPILSEQTKIANFLSAIDDKISNNQSQIEKMEIWKKGLLQKMFC